MGSERWWDDRGGDEHRRRHSRAGGALTVAATIPAVDPHAKRGLVRRAFYSFGQSKAGRWYGIKIGSRIDPPLLRLTRGRFATTSLLPLVLLQVRGARSGEMRTIPLVYFTEGDDVILIASSFGRAKNPAWYYNLVANP
ncbi:MAG: nitroreductase family deazaflavin-dependent oxidoreductase, partial [Acidobacteria bacterium]|nr:nitroreductase family deazaflavin-dependent oxidoreductase [Acidobacteriota bacterium]